MLHQPAHVFRPSPAEPIDRDATILVALDDLRAARKGFEASAEGSEQEASFEADERAAFDVIVTTPAASLAGLVAKAQLLFVEKNARIDYPDEDAVAAEIADRPQYHEDRIALALVLDIMRLARVHRDLPHPALIA